MVCLRSFSCSPESLWEQRLRNRDLGATKQKCAVRSPSLSRVQLCDCHGLYSPPGFSFHRISQARIPEWVFIPYSKWGSSQPRDRTSSLASPALAGRFFTTAPPADNCLADEVFRWPFILLVSKPRDDYVESEPCLLEGGVDSEVSLLSTVLFWCFFTSSSDTQPPCIYDPVYLEVSVFYPEKCKKHSKREKKTLASLFSGGNTFYSFFFWLCDDVWDQVSHNARARDTCVTVFAKKPLTPGMVYNGFEAFS